MHRKHMLINLLFTVVIFTVLASSAWGGAEEIKARMAERLPVIMELKAKGIVGENNQGLLQFIGTAKDKADVVEAENKDRTIVYKAIAKKTGTTPEIVGQRRAQQIAENAKAGEWFQNETGQWKQK